MHLGEQPVHRRVQRAESCAFVLGTGWMHHLASSPFVPDETLLHGTCDRQQPILGSSSPLLMQLARLKRRADHCPWLAPMGGRTPQSLKEG
jgi:hypothetical protein